jgi:DMSO/TMAO reductase YedYZ heme-binding membrane subunit
MALILIIPLAFQSDRVGRDRTIIKEWQALINTLGYGYRVVLVVNHEMLGYSCQPNLQ